MFSELITESAYSALKNIFRAISMGNKTLKNLLITLGVLAVSGISLFILSERNIIDRTLWFPVSIILLVSSLILFIGLSAYSTETIQVERQNEINSIEERVRNNETQAAWELAQKKLENYLNRNLTQVRMIFIWTILVMLIGFGIIIWGIYKVFDSNNNFNASIIATVSGILIEVIGATFLFVYKSTMTQAKEYVSILERINVVGMSIQVIDSMESSSQQVKEQAKLELSKQIIDFYKAQNTNTQ